MSVISKDSEGELVVLDSFKVVDLRTVRDLTIQPDDTTYMRERGLYPIFSDSYVQHYWQH